MHTNICEYAFSQNKCLKMKKKMMRGLQQAKVLFVHEDLEMNELMAWGVERGKEVN